MAAADTGTLPAPPVAKKVPHVSEVNGHKMVDNYFWLRDKPNPAVRAYLEAENAYTDAVMKPTEAFQKKLYDEMLGRIKETDVEVPYREGDYFYYMRTEAGKQYGIRCRKKASMDAPEEVVLDINELAKGQAFMSVAAFDGKSGWKSAGVFVRQYRVPAIHAGGERSADGADAGGSCGARGVGGVGER